MKATKAAASRRNPRRALAAAATLSLAGAFLVMAPGAAHSAEFTVNSNGDKPDASPGDPKCATVDGLCTLRAAVMQANASGGTDTITVPAMTITLGSELELKSNITIKGAGARETIVTATSGHRNVFVSGGTVQVSDVALQDITTNAPYGAGIHQTNGNLTLTRVRVTNIKATSPNSTVYAPVLIENGTMTMTDSEVSRNSVTTTGANAYGAGVSTGNSINSASTVRIVNSSIVDNAVTVSPSDFSYFALGGGVLAGANHAVEVESSTIAGNSATNGVNGRGGNIYAFPGGSGSFWMKDSIIAQGADSQPNSDNCSPGTRVIEFAGRNLVDDTTCGADAPTLTVGSARLRAVGNNGGPTDTRPPGPDSKALNAASECITPADQRGTARPVAGGCDLGAVELVSDPGVTATLSNPAPSPDADVILTVVASNAGPDTTTGTTATITGNGGQILSATPQAGSCNITSGAVTCALPDLPAQASTTILVGTRAPRTGTATFQATVTAAQPDSNPGNNSADAQASVSSPGPGGSNPDTPPAVGACTNRVTGTAKGDRLTGTANGDSLDGKGGKDRLAGLAGDDCLSGGAGPDTLLPGPGADKVTSGPGSDTVKARDGARDVIRCGPGRDKVVGDKKDKIAKDCEAVRR